MVERFRGLLADGLSLRGIIAALDAERYRPRPGRAVSPVDIARILAR